MIPGLKDRATNNNRRITYKINRSIHGPVTNKKFFTKRNPLFSIQFGGMYNPNVRVFSGIHKHGHYWALNSNTNNSEYVLIREEFGVIWLYNERSSFWMSVRCVKK